MNRSKESSVKSNVIWILGDQHRAQALGCNGDPNVSTPNIDNLAAMGVNFVNAVSGFPLCCPFRGSMLTSRYPHNCVPGHEYQLPPEQRTIANEFNDHGYHTAYFGKWHLDGYQEKLGRASHHIIPPDRRGGFKQWVGYENNNSQWDCWVHGGEGESAFHYRLPGYETDELTNLFTVYLEDMGQKQKEGSGEPFFAVLSVQPPHNPYISPEETRKRHIPANVQLRTNVPAIPKVQEKARLDLSGYYAMIENLDWNVGKIRRTLSECGLADNTHIVFFSDHGDMHGSHGQYLKTLPYEESIRVPFIISGETAFYNGRKTGKSQAMMNHVDIAPTTLGLCGIDKPGWMEGTDFSGHRLSSRDVGEQPDSAFLQSPTARGNVDKPWRGIVTKDGWKYVCFEGCSWMLFNLKEDPYELVNQAHNPQGVYASKRKELQEQLVEWIHKTGDRFQVPVS
ncbi:sulfatase [Paenibacillus radicis (ex Xue et al. 2023)]|uniref:Sulfatase n=1 Tax=Paenibacillus radicis (ex Xue et al. 2023) TaxID=2972489 RepID=A0ABT1YE01_9BACL|nr:sulfatase [Paenibacillus radicis (ex Xue et al. 2023)]MCR8630448.1 sulfatase [Paenibacillus radicis (ex Xue et al. 2023)]